jgi:uncharacterized protein (UPF0335 family)
MARPRKDSQGDVPEGAAGIGHNGFRPEAAKEFVARIERLLDDLASEKGEYMRKAKTIREDIALVLDDAKAAGVPKKELKAVIKTRELEMRAAAIRDDLEGDAQETFDMIRAALGDLADLPLGQAALGQSHAAA